jgi:pyruvate ferredoxin oxidoreductase beta subunit
LAVQTGWNVIYEIENGVFRLNSASEQIARNGKLRPLIEYIREQGRFKNITEEQVSQLQTSVSERWKHYLERAGITAPARENRD